jgi:uncharacterized protein YjiS (DUF1127 family)
MPLSIIRMEGDMTTIDFGIDRPGYLSRFLELLSRLVGAWRAQRDDQLPLDELRTWSPARLADLGLRPGDLGERGDLALSTLRRNPWS